MDRHRALARPRRALKAQARALGSREGVLDCRPSRAGTYDMPITNRIAIDPLVRGGRPCIRGLRILVNDIHCMLAGGSTRQEFALGRTHLEDEDVPAALECASRAIKQPMVAEAD